MDKAMIPTRMAGAQAAPAAYWTVADPVAGACVLLAGIEWIRQDEPIDAIIPCLDADLPKYITRQPALAQRGIRLMLPDRTTLYSRNKEYLLTLCAKAKAATPLVCHIIHEGFFDLNGIDGEFWRYPMVVKGIFYDAYVVHTAVPLISGSAFAQSMGGPSVQGAQRPPGPPPGQQYGGRY